MRRPLPFLLCASLLAGALLAGPVQANEDATQRDFPGRGLLARPLAGKAALKQLGDRLGEAAATNRMTSARLKRLLESDRTTTLSREGRLFFADQVTEPDLVDPIKAAQSLPQPALYPADQTFALHSNPASTHTIFLDFDGYALPAGNAWATDAGVPALSFDGSSTDPAYVQEVWRIVSEKFAPFDVDVTTQDPGPDGLNRTTSGDLRFGTRVVFTDDARARPSTCPANGCVGVAWLGVFDRMDPADRYEPAWVFTTLQFSGSAPSRVNSATAAAAAAHEVGHTFGLLHDGTPSASYFDGRGHGNWFPLMGSGWNAVGQWSKGEYDGANNTEDDTAIIAAHGAPLRADDAGNTVADADPLGQLSSYTQDGVISTPDDTDVYAVTRSCVGPLTATASGIGVGQSVDLRVQVLSSTGGLLADIDPPSSQTGPYTQQPTGLDAIAIAPIADRGTYFVQVSGVGRGSAITDGYSRYGSLGGYRLTISGCPGDPAPPTAPDWPVVTVPISPPLPFSPAPPPGIVPSSAPPSAPGIARASSGRRGRPVNAVARWSTPLSAGGGTILGYRVRAVRLSSSGRVLGTKVSALLPSDARTFAVRLPAGRYRFVVVAINRFGSSPASRSSTEVVAR